MLADKVCNLSVEFFFLAVLFLQLLLVSPAVFLELVRHFGGVSLLGPKLRALVHHFLFQLVGFGLQLIEPRLLRFQRRGGLLHFHGLLAHLRGEVAEIAHPVKGLVYRTAGEDVHIPEPGIPVLVRTSYQARIIVLQGVVTRVQAVQFPLAHPQGIVQNLEGLVVAGDDLLAGRYLAPHQGEAAQDLRAFHRVLVQLAVQKGDVLLQLGALVFQALDRSVLRSGTPGRG